MRLGPSRALPFFAMVVAGLLAYAVGIRGDALLGTVLIAGLPTTMVMQRITAWLIPPELEVTGHFRGILHPVSEVDPNVDSVASASVAESGASIDGPVKVLRVPPDTGGAGATSRVHRAGSLRSLAVHSQHRPSRGPGAGRNEDGAPRLPTDRSHRTRRCRVHESVIGRPGVRGGARRGRMATAFTMPALGTTHVSYESFRSANESGQQIDPESAARSQIRIQCEERSGTQHFADIR